MSVPSTLVAGLSAAQAGSLIVDQPVYFRDLVALVDYAATVTSVTPGQTLVITVTSSSATQTFSLAGDGTALLPVYSLS